ncbi:hypothetical protein [Salinisphaera sp. G21_0]|uniref:hypothetical protein n=1 Tax=Salinisphaera sp. G21_0 TaxID=2821094 RepID=UPI001ADA5890|nr:hypothetical protein [Salinisphaera sp. G21_0]MBO9484348.1 hypothetical protein [Salinisphaera sp. G21_0]
MEANRAIKPFAGDQFMSMYPHTGAALINAFNYSLFDTYKSACWQRLASELCDKYPELDRPIPEDRNFDRSRLTRSDWATQAGMVSGLLRNRLSNLEYHLLRIRYTFDGEMLSQKPGISVRLKMTDNLRSALVEGWPEIHGALRIHPETPRTLAERTVKLEYLGLRALRPDVIKDTFKASGEEAQKTITNQQYKVKRSINQMVQAAYNNAQIVLESEGLTKAAE